MQQKALRCRVAAINKLRKLDSSAFSHPLTVTMLSMPEPRMTLDYEPPKPSGRGKMWLIVGVLVFAGLILCTFVLSTVHVTRLTPPIAPMGPATHRDP